MLSDGHNFDYDLMIFTPYISAKPDLILKDSGELKHDNLGHELGAMIDTNLVQRTNHLLPKINLS